ncbi:MAG: AAA family ATPase, partial [bacterium]|nr:AAA family ATPase [bacterium]
EPVAVPEPVRSVPEAERRQLTVMFCDLADSTKLSGQLDPEDLRDIIRAYQQTCAEVIQRFDGYIARYMGDGLLVYFGYPQAHEDDAQRAVRTGLEIMSALPQLNTHLGSRIEILQAQPLQVRIGVHTGLVVIETIGTGLSREHQALGETPNIAARLEGLAASNTVVMSHITARLVQGAFALENLGPHDLKGVAEPIQVFRALRPLEVYEDEARVSTGVPFLVGRDEETGLLMRRWEQSKEGLGQVVLVSGTAGIGKSSLVETLRAHVRDESLPRIAFRCSSYHQNSVLYPVTTRVERLLDFQREDAAAAKLDKLEQGLRPYSLPLAEVVPLFASLLSVPLDDRYPAPTLTPQQLKQQTLDALVAWLLEEAEQQPALVVWEDLHWADPSTLEMLGLVLEQTPTVQMLHVLTFRPEFDQRWPTRSHMTPITLNRLERPQVEALITHLAGRKTLPQEVVEHITGKTDGVPLYVEELTKMLLESDLLREEADAYVLTGPLLTVAIPDTLQDSLMARLDQMNTAKEVAQLGAVLGREFPYELVQAISSQDEETLQAGLAQLVEAELLYQRGRPPRARYIFKHALIQDTAYASLLRSTQQRVHQQIARQLEARFSETVETQPELVAHHYTEGGQAEQAMVYWQQAGQRAVQRSAYHEAIVHLTKGLEVITQLPEPPDPQRAFDLHMTLGPALIATKGFGAPEVEQTYTRARGLCEQVGEPPQQFQVMMGLWNCYLLRGTLPQAQDLAEELLHLAEEINNPALLLAAYRALGTTLTSRGDFTAARDSLEQGLALYDPDQHRELGFRYGADPGVFCHLYMGRVKWACGYPDQGRQHIETAQTIADALSQPFSQAFALAMGAGHYQFRGEVQRAEELAEDARDLSATHGFTQWLANSRIYHGWSWVMLGHASEGLAEMHKGLTGWREMGAELSLPYFLGQLAEAYWRAGQMEEGLRALDEALVLVEHHDEHWYEAELHRLRGELLLSESADHSTEVTVCLQKAISIAQNQSAKSWELRATTSLARLWQSQDKRQEAYDLLAPVYNWFTEGFGTADLKDAKTLLDELAEGQL